MVSYQNHRADMKCIDNNDTVSNSFIWFHSKNETINPKVKLSRRNETQSCSKKWNLSIYLILNNSFGINNFYA